MRRVTLGSPGQWTFAPRSEEDHGSGRVRPGRRPRADRPTPATIPEAGSTAADSLAFSPDGRTLASGDGGGVIMLWDVVAGEELLTLEPHAGPVHLIRFSPDGQTLASCADRPDGTSEIFLWHASRDEMDRAAPDPDRNGEPAR
jgi:WD40 repeat protein